MSSRMFFRRCLIGYVLVLGPSPISARGETTWQADARPLEDLHAVPPGSAPRALQVRLRWTTDAPTRNPAATQSHFDVISIDHLATPAVAPRTSAVGPDTLVIVGEAASGRELSWRVVGDPRVVRAESSSSSTLVGERLVYLEAELIVALPDVPGTIRIRIYKPRSQNGRTVLDALGASVIR